LEFFWATQESRAIEEGRRARGVGNKDEEEGARLGASRHAAVVRISLMLSHY
jgi:hypothetical protein